MEPHVKIAPHVDADDPKVDMIATLCVSGGLNTLRVGNVEFKISAGDVYILTGFARHHVKHEVLASPMERITITLRYISQDNEYRSSV